MKNNSPFKISEEQLQRVHTGLGFLLWSSILSLIASVAFLGVGGLSLIGMIAAILGIIAASKLRSVIEEILSASFEGNEQPKKIVQQMQEVPRKPEMTEETRKPDTVPARTGFGSIALQSMTEEQKKYSKNTEKHEPSILDTVDWEQWIGQKLLQKAGILIVLIGMIVFLKYSFDNHLIGELGRIALSALVGIVLLGAGEYFNRRYALWSHTFSGAGIALLYFTVWAAHVFYHEVLLNQYGIAVSPAMAMSLYSMITFVGTMAAVRYKAQTIAWFTMLGGYLTPLLITSPEPNFVNLTIYLAILAGGMLMLSWHQKWTFIALAAFGLTQTYLFSSTYASGTISDTQQNWIAIGFFILFALPPLLYQFKRKRAAEFDDIALNLLDGLVTFLAVVDGLGGFGGEYVGLVSLLLATIYIGFAAMALNQRKNDRLLVNTYLLSGIGLIALALFAQMKFEWVAAGWAPFSILLLLIARSIREKGMFGCAIALLGGSLLFLFLNMPVFQPNDIVWQPFTSHWALLSYIVFLSLLAWVRISESLPDELESSDGFIPHLVSNMHTFIACILFIGVTFEATRLHWAITLPLSLSYISFSVVAIMLFAYTERIIWFIAAFCVQLLVLAFTFLLSNNSGMVTPLLQGASVVPFFHPWAAVSCLSILTMLGLLWVILRKPKHDMHILPIRTVILGIVLTQVWLHVTVEIEHLQTALAWSDILFERVLSGWWIVFSIPLFWQGIQGKKERCMKAAVFALSLPFLKDFLLMISRQTDLYELSLWTAIPLILLVTLIRTKQDALFPVGIVMIVGTMIADMFSTTSGDVSLLPTAWWTFIPLLLIMIAVQQKKRVLLNIGLVLIIATIFFDQAHTITSSVGVLRTIWWTMVAMIVMAFGFMKREKVLRQFAICMFGAAVIKLLIFDFAGLSTGVRIAASILTGLVMIGASYMYQRFDALLTQKH